MEPTIELGMTVKDKITGFTGIAYARAEYLYDSPQIGVAAKVCDPSKETVREWFNPCRLEIVSDEKPSTIQEG